MNNLKKKILFVLFVVLLCSFPLTAMAHSGRTDSSGGHHDYKNKSGLGSYHYHHGMGHICIQVEYAHTVEEVAIQLHNQKRIHHHHQ